MFNKIECIISFYSGLICWYFEVLNVTNPVVHPLFDADYNVIIDVLIAMVASDYCLYRFLICYQRLD